MPELSQNTAVPFGISSSLLIPVATVLDRRPPAVAARVQMPEAAVHIDDFGEPRKNDVGRAGDVSEELGPSVAAGKRRDSTPAAREITIIAITLASARVVRHVVGMKSATAEQVPQQWSQIRRWIAAGEEVQVIDHDKVVARLVPPMAIGSPDFVARAKTIWGDTPAGTPLSQVISEARGGGG